MTADFIPDFLCRSELMLGKEKIQKLHKAHVLVVGLGGVGGICAEMLVRSGVGNITIIDGDVVEKTNRNRQIVALCSTEGQSKALSLEKRFKDINPDVNINAIQEYLRDERTNEILREHKFDYAVDCIDTLSPKVFLIQACIQMNIPLVSSMGAGGKINPSLIQIDDISQTYKCQLARYVRKRLKRLGIESGVKAVFSPEPIDHALVQRIDNPNDPKKSIVGTISYMPALFGINCASVVIRDLLNS